jgi:small subunit ribosomal protein S4e
MRGGLIQLTFHDGRTLTFDSSEKTEIPIHEISPKDSILYNLESNTIEEHYPFAEGNIGVVMGGHNVGILGTITEIETQIGRKKRTITFQTEEGELKTTDNHIFIVGKEKAMITIPDEHGESVDES